MGLFRKRAKEYSFAQAKQLLLTEEYAKYAAIPVNYGDPNTKYKLVLEDPLLQEEKQRRMAKKQSEEFMNGLKVGFGDGAEIPSSRDVGTTLKTEKGFYDYR